MIQGWEKYTGKKPEFEQGLDFTKATFYLKPAREGTTPITTPMTTPITTPKTQEKILELLRKNPLITRKEIAEILGGITKDGVKYYLNKLRMGNKIKRMGGSKGGYWKILVS